jgi:hypothetical protein
MMPVKPEHILLSIEDFLDNYFHKLIHKTPKDKRDTKRSVTTAKGVLTGDNGMSLEPPKIRGPHIYYLPQLLRVSARTLSRYHNMGPTRLSVVEAAVKDLGYNLGDLSDHVPLALLQCHIDEKAQEFSTEIKTIEGYDSQHNQEQLAYTTLKTTAKEGLAKIFGLTQDAAPSALSSDGISKKFNLFCLIETALLQQLGIQQKPDARTESGKAFQKAVLYVHESIEAQAGFIKLQFLDFNKK